MMYNQIITESQDGAFIITINRTDKLNALNKETLKEIAQAVKFAENESNIYGIILTGAGIKAFAAGADISEFQGLDVEGGKAFAASGHEIMTQIEQCTKPVIAAVNGYALGGGCELAMACHIRLASENALFGQPEANLGLIPGYGGTQRLAKLIGPGRAIELLITTKTINAETALNWGLVNQLTNIEDLLPQCKELIKKISSKAPLAISGILRCVYSGLTSHTEGFEKEIDVFGNCFGTEDHKEGIHAFLEKRKAVFKGR